MTEWVISTGRITHRFPGVALSVVKRVPCVFRGKDSNTMTVETYFERILLHVVQWVWQRMELISPRTRFMQDNASCHKAGVFFTCSLWANVADSIFLSAFSPDLDLIEAVWSLMNIYIQTHYFEFKRGLQRSRNEVRQIIQKVWDAITSDPLDGRITGMPVRCQAVIYPDRGPTRY